MKLHEILEQEKPGDWFRPTWYDGSGMAFNINNNMLCIVPTARGAQPAILNIEALKSDWVFVSPDVVIAECQKWSQ